MLREATTAAGFVEVSVNGQSYSSDPASAAFDPHLAGATAATVTGIRLAGGEQATLALGPEQLSGSLTVSAPGATVVRGTLHGSASALAASSWMTVEAHGAVLADSAAGGGQVAIAADKFVNSGQVHADGPTGGQIDVRAGNVLNAGPVTTDGTSGAGGAVHIAFTGAYIDTAAAFTAANGTLGEPGASGPGGRGGQVVIDGGATGHLFSSGHQLATGAVGGAVTLLGGAVVLDGGAVDVSGQTGGGSVQIRGQVANADALTVTQAATLRADALASGNGGRVLVRAEQDMAFAGIVSARGGPGGGAGGFIDVSSQGALSYGGTADAGADAGRAGTLLLDPKNLVIDASTGVFPQFDLIDPHPTAGGVFGYGASVLSNGNVVADNINDNFGGTNAGAVYLFNGFSGALISTLVGSHPNDYVAGINLVGNGNYVVDSPHWNANTGAVTWGSGTTGVSGIVSAANSLVCSNPNDRVGDYGVTALSGGNYVVDSELWNGNRGAVTWGSGTTGVSGFVSAANSLVGSNAGDQIGSGRTQAGYWRGVVALSNGNYVVSSPSWNHGLGAATWGDGTTGVSGQVSAANSLVGSDLGGSVAYNGIMPFYNGNYLVLSPGWNGNRGAVTWGSGTQGVTGPLTGANSLVGSNPGDQVGTDGTYGSPTITPLANGNYIVLSPVWNNYRGAATWGNGSAGVSGAVSDANSLVGTAPGDVVGYNGVTPLGNGNYVVSSPNWNGGCGAAT
jgi:hypothetical protein